MELKYETRDGKGNDIVKMVKIKEFPVENMEFICPNLWGRMEYF